MGSEAAAGVSEMRLEERRENELRAARRKLSKFVVDHERHNLKPDDSKMKKMHWSGHSRKLEKITRNQKMRRHQ